MARLDIGVGARSQTALGRLAAVLSSSIFAWLSLTGCVGECRYYNDCPEGEVCSREKVCVSNGLSGTGGNINIPRPNPDGGTSGGTVEATMQTEFPIPWMTVDPRDPSRGLFAAFAEAGAIDDLRSFDLASGAIREPADIDLVSVGPLDPDIVGAPCQADNLYPEPTIPNSASTPETWLICKQGPGVRVYYNNNFAQPGMSVEPSTEGGYVMQKVAVTGTDTNDFQRRLTFARGGAELHVYQLNPNQDGVFVTRDKDTVQETFTAITQVWQLPSIPNVGDVLVVFDRASPPRLVPLLRQRGSVIWELATPFTTLEVLPLPDETHAVIQIAAIDPQGLSPPGTPNVMTVEPSTGFLRFFVMAAIPPDPPQVELFTTNFEPNAAFRAPSPEPEERLLLEDAPGAEATFYVHPRVGRVWRLPHAPNAENDVFVYTIGGGALFATGIIPTGPLTTWVSVPNTLELLKVTLAQRD